MPERYAAAESERPIGVATSAPYLPELEALRGLAMLQVFAFHLDAFVGWNLRHGHHWVDPLSAFVRAGDTGVNLFFVLSAFLLTLPFARPAAVPDTRRYFSRRALRILPLYYAAVLVGTVALAEHAADLLRGVPYLFFLNAWPGLATPLPPFSNVWWSLATEWQFYVALPLVAALLRRWGWRAVGAGAVLWAVAYALWIGRLVRLGLADADLLLGMSLFGRAPYFACGAAAAWLWVRHAAGVRAWLAHTPLATPRGANLVLAAVLAALAVLMQALTFLGPFTAQVPPWHAHNLIEAPLWAALVLLVLFTPTHARVLLRARWLIFLGVISYSVYVVHVPVLQLINLLRHAGVRGLVGWNWRTAGVAVALAAVTFLVSLLTYRLIERPFLARKERVSG